MAINLKRIAERLSKLEEAIRGPVVPQTDEGAHRALWLRELDMEELDVLERLLERQSKQSLTPDDEVLLLVYSKRMREWMESTQN